MKHFKTYSRTLETLKMVATVMGGFSLTFLYGYVVMALLFHFELTDWSRLNPTNSVAVQIGLGVPFLLLQIRLTQFAIDMKDDLTN